MLLIGVGFFSVRFADILAFRLGSVPQQIPLIGGQAVTVGRVLGVIPLSIGLSVLASKIFGRTVPVVEDISDAALGSIDSASRNTAVVNPVNAEQMDEKTEESLYKQRSKKPSKKFKKGERASISHDTSKPKTTHKPWRGKQKTHAAEEAEVVATAEAETEEPESFKAETESKPAGGTPAQKLWRECVRDSKGDMALAKKLRKERS